MRRLLLLACLLLLQGCVISSARLVHPETKDVRYCWQYNYVEDGQLRGDN